MDIKEARAKKVELERNIAEVLQRFELDTETSIESIQLRRIDDRGKISIEITARV